MTKSNITEYDKVAANNTDVQDVPLGENQMYPSDVNNAFREIMADLAAVNDGTVSLTSPSFAAASLTGNLTFGDGDRARFGNGFDLQLYHDGSNSYIDESSGVGNLIIKGANIEFKTTTNESYMNLSNNGAVTLYHDNSEKLATTATGVDVTGTVEADGLIVEGTTGNFEVATTGNSVNMTRAGNNFITASNASGDLYLGAGGTLFLKIDNGGDISFYEDTGTTAKFFWDASAESLGIGTSSPEGTLHIENVSNNSVIMDAPANRFNSIGFQTAGVDKWWLGRADSDEISGDAFFIGNDNGNATDAGGFSNKLVITQSGSVGIGTSSPSSLLAVSSGSSSAAVHSYTNLEIESASHSALQFSGSTGAEQWIWFADDSSNPPVGGITYYHGGPYMGFRVEGSERMRIDGSGRVGIGTSSPTASLDIPAGGIRLNSSGSDTSSKVGNFGVAGFEGYIEPYDSNAFTNIVNTVASKGITFQTGGSERMRINSSGSVGIGTSSPAAQLHVQNSSGNSTSILGQYGTGTRAEITAFSNQVELRAYNGTNDVMTFKTGSSERMRIDNLGNIIVYGAGISYPGVAATFGRGPNAIGFTWSSPNIYGTVDNVVEMVVGTASDYRLKANDENLTGSLQTIMALRPVSYNPVNFDGVVDEDKQELGLIAHEVQAVRPSIVTGEKDAIGEDGNARYQSVNYAGLVPDLIAALQEAIAKIETLESRLDTLENK